MSLHDLRAAYQRGQLSKLEYFTRMQSEHSRLSDYAAFLPATSVAMITVSEGQVAFTTRQHGVTIVCDPSDMGIPPIVALNLGDYEKDDGTMLLSLIDDGMTFFDIGANLGWYALHVARLFSRSRVFAFEPIPKTFGYLKKNVAVNGLTNMQVFPFGLFSEASERVFFVNPAIMGAASTSEKATGGGEPQVCRVETLDSVVDRLAVDVDFIKADVEGAELLVFQGGMNAIKRSKPIIFAEMLRKHSAMFGYHPNDIIRLLGESGYLCFVSRDGSLVRFAEVDENTTETNYLFLHPEKHAEKIKQRTR